MGYGTLLIQLTVCKRILLFLISSVIEGILTFPGRTKNFWSKEVLFGCDYYLVCELFMALCNLDSYYFSIYWRLSFEIPRDNLKLLFNFVGKKEKKRQRRIVYDFSDSQIPTILPHLGLLGTMAQLGNGFVCLCSFKPWCSITYFMSSGPGLLKTSGHIPLCFIQWTNF